ncbi:MAG: EamA family transporter [Gammaproteobacteria bacterium]
MTLLSAFAFASADAATKKYFADADVWDSIVVRFVLSGMALLPWLMLSYASPDSWRFWPWLGALVPLDIVAIYLYVRAITIAPFSHTLPYLAFTPVLTAASGWLLLGEAIPLRGLAGIVLVSLGAYLLNLDSTTWRQDKLAPLRFIAREQGPRLMLGVAVIFSVTSTLGKGALQYMPAAQFGPLYGAVLAAATAAVVLVRRRRLFDIVHRRPLGAALVSAAMAIMVLTHFIAIEQVEAAYMIAVKRTSMLFGLVYGAVLFGERQLGRNLAAGVVMVGGVVLLTGWT